MENFLAPIVVFTYNRPMHTKKTIEALKNNIGSQDSPLIIYADGSKNDVDRRAVDTVRKYLKEIDGFESITIVEREENWGLARNIIDGVTKVVNKYGKIIVLEDDVVTSKNFLKYMNDALNIYKDKKKVMQISGTIFEKINRIHLPETFFSSLGESCGWGTWDDRWVYFKRNPKELVKSYDLRTIQEFIKSGVPGIWDQVKKNADGSLCSWAVFFHNAIFQRNGLVLVPRNSLTTNIGFDGTGVNCGFEDKYITKLTEMEVSFFPEDFCIRNEVKEVFENFFQQSKNDLLDFARQYKTLICYGAGEYAKYVFGFLKKNDIRVSAFVISDDQQSAEELVGIPVYKFSQINFPIHCGVILSLDLQFHNEIKKRLIESHIIDVYEITGDLITIIKDDIRYFE